MIVMKKGGDEMKDCGENKVEDKKWMMIGKQKGKK